MAEPIWNKGDGPTARDAVDAAIERFMCGIDRELDRVLLPFDVRASKAHVRGLQRIGVLTAAEATALCAALDELAAQVARGDFAMEPPIEDGHSAIELRLTESLGELGRKVHTGRSRNDQVQVAMRLYLIDALDRLAGTCREIATVALTRAESKAPTPMPGYTHLQRAVPSSLEHWFAGYAEAFIDLVELARFTRRWISALPLGTAAGFGVNLPLDREGMRRELGFERIQINPQYVQHSRGRFELQVVGCIAQATLELRRWAWDLSLFACEEFGFVRIPDRYATGSSIMPNKRNPDVIELLRGQHAIVQGAMSELQAVLALPGGYHRDLQLTKPPTIRGVEGPLSALALVPRLVAALEFDADRMRAAISPEMYATDVAIERAVQGTAFRDAYRAALTDKDLAGRTPEASISERTSPGACGNLQLDELRRRLAESAPSPG